MCLACSSSLEDDELDSLELLLLLELLELDDEDEDDEDDELCGCALFLRLILDLRAPTELELIILVDSSPSDDFLLLPSGSKES